MPSKDQIAFIDRQSIRPTFRENGTWDGKSVTIGAGSLLEALWELVRAGHFNDARPCRFSGCIHPGTHGHHVTYDPPAIMSLCAQHHRDITVCNINISSKQRRKLTNKQRWWIWYQWIEGKMEPNYDANAEQYLKTFRD